jgi:hypothetical protein
MGCYAELHDDAFCSCIVYATYRDEQRSGRLPGLSDFPVTVIIQ